MRFSPKHLFIATAAMLFFSAASSATTITQTVQFGPGLTDYNAAPGTPAAFFYFDSNLGALNSVTFASTYQFNSTITVLAFSNASGTVATQSAAQFGSTDSAVTKVLNTAVNNLVSLVDGATVTMGSKSLSPIAYDIFGKTSSYNLVRGSSGSFQSAGSGSTGAVTDTSLADLSAFFKPGGGTYSILLNTLTGASFSQSGGNAAASQITIANASLTVSYDYTAGAPPVAVTPEPSSLVLFGTGALGLLGVARRRLA